jgi:4-hydroxybenzoate polyprenyltransferase
VNPSNPESPSATRRSIDWGAHVGIARPDYWFKNVFVIPGIIVALGTVSGVDAGSLTARIAVGVVAICLIASSKYSLNEVLDAPSDRHHPE